VSQLVLHLKEPSQLKAIRAKHRSKFAALSQVMVTAARKLKIARAAINNQTNKQNMNDYGGI
jgi:hypothetical protein